MTNQLTKVNRNVFKNFNGKTNKANIVWGNFSREWNPNKDTSLEWPK